jgi:very-short-patch-repair endonuclease
MYEIEKCHWEVCVICNKTLKQIKKEIGGSGIYFSRAFIKHIESHNINISDYFENNLKLNRPICRCGQTSCQKKCKVTYQGSKLKWRKWVCGRNPGQQKWSEEAKTSRRGVGNPMFQKIPWNKNKTHSNKAKEKMKKSALKRLERGDGVFTDTKPHLKMCSLLDSLSIKYQKEKTIGNKSFDIYLLDLNIAIEVDGDYWHCNPRIYPNGPINDIQKSTIEKDKYKNDICLSNNITLLRFWEFDIMNNEEDVICTLKKFVK